MLTTPSPSRNIIHHALPMLIAQVAVMLNGTLDTVMTKQLLLIDLAVMGINMLIWNCQPTRGGRS
ncbi:MAG: hypothetical protein WAO76_01525 [Georgfuchsia sp.]